MTSHDHLRKESYELTAESLSNLPRIFLIGFLEEEMRRNQFFA